MEWFESISLSLLSRAQSLWLYERHPMCPHVSVQVSLRFKILPTNFAFGVWRPVVVLICNIQLVLSLTLVVVFAPSVVPDEALWLLQPMHDKEVSGQWAVRGVAQATLLTLIGRAVRLVLRNVLVERCDVLGGEAADCTIVDFKDVHLEPLQWLWVRTPRVQAWSPVILLWLPFWAEALWWGLNLLVRNQRRTMKVTSQGVNVPQYRFLVRWSLHIIRVDSLPLWVFGSMHQLNMLIQQHSFSERLTESWAVPVNVQ